MAQVGRFRESLDLSEVLPSYREHLGAFGGTAGVNFVDGSGPSEHDPFENEAIPRSLYARQSQTETPTWIGEGPPTCSTCTDVVSARATFAWDVNGWYRTLGLAWPYVQATSGDLSRAYIAAGGQRSARCTYYLKQLLNRPVRASYDLTALGTTFLDDQYVQDAMKAQAQEEASRRSAEGTFTDATEVLDEWGYLLKPEDGDGLDAEQGPVQDEVSPESDSFNPVEWSYSYWLWHAYGQADAVVRLEQWQTLLVSALSVRGAKVDLAVGLMGQQLTDYLVGYSDGYWIVYLSEKAIPTEELAAQAADMYLKTISEPI